MNLYFPQIITGQNDWIEIFNIGIETANINIIGRDCEAQIVWTKNIALPSFYSRVIASEVVIDEDMSIQISSDQPLVGSRYMAFESGIIVLPGASEYSKTVGKRFFIPSEPLPYTVTTNWFRFFSVGANSAKLYFIFRTNNGQIITDRDFHLEPFCWWDVGQEEQNIPKDFYLEILSDQYLVVEKHIFYYIKGQKMMIAYIYPLVDCNKPVIKNHY